MPKRPTYYGTVIHLQECKGSSVIPRNRAVDNGFMGDLGSLWAVNLMEEDPVHANRINY